MSKRFLLTLLTILIIFGATGVAVFLAKGYRFSSIENRIVGTGIISISSEPSSASVYIDGHLTTATNSTVSSLSPKKYMVRVIKEGLIPWEKEVEVKEGLVSEVKVTLFPGIPTMYPLTFTGVNNPVLSPDGSKLAYVVSSGKKSGVWVWTMVNNQPIAFARSSEPHQVAQTNTTTDFAKSTLQWSPDSKQIIATITSEEGLPINNYLLESDVFSSEPRDITPVINTTVKEWQTDVEEREATRVLTITDVKARRIASDSAIVKWSPDETKFMYVTQSPVASHQPSEKTSLKDNDEVSLTTESSLDFKVYDLETNTTYALPEAKAYSWLPNSKHVVLIEEGAVSIIEFDGTNKAVIYAGNFLDNFVFAWPDSSRLVLISSFPTPTASEPNLYGINLK